MESDRKSARERAYEIFAASGGKMSVQDIMAHLHMEGHKVSRTQVDTWKSRDTWKVRIMGEEKPSASPVEFQRILIGPKLTMLEQEQRVNDLADVSKSILALASGLSGALLKRIKALQPEDIAVKDIPGLTEATGKLWTLYLALDAETNERRAALAKDITPENADAPGLPSGPPLTPMAERALAWEAERKKGKPQ